MLAFSGLTICHRCYHYIIYTIIIGHGISDIKIKPAFSYAGFFIAVMSKFLYCFASQSYILIAYKIKLNSANAATEINS